LTIGAGFEECRVTLGRLSFSGRARPCLGTAFLRPLVFQRLNVENSLEGRPPRLRQIESRPGDLGILTSTLRSTLSEGQRFHGPGGIGRRSLQ
jgi:hypothetical protein